MGGGRFGGGAFPGGAELGGAESDSFASPLLLVSLGGGGDRFGGGGLAGGRESAALSSPLRPSPSVLLVSFAGCCCCAGAGDPRLLPSFVLPLFAAAESFCFGGGPYCDVLSLVCC